MKTLELFPIESVRMDSPKLAWMKRHGIITLHHRPGHCPATWLAGFQTWWPDLHGVHFFAEETAHNGDSRIGEGDTEDEALVSLLTCGEARRRGILHWHQEPR